MIHRAQPLSTNTNTHSFTTEVYKHKTVGFYSPIAPPVPNVPALRSLHAAALPVQSEYPVERCAVAAVPLPESP